MVHFGHIRGTLSNLPELFEGRTVKPSGTGFREPSLYKPIGHSSPDIYVPDTQPGRRRQIPIAENLPEPVEVALSKAQAMGQRLHFIVLEGYDSAKVNLRCLDRNAHSMIELRAPVRPGLGVH